MTIIMDRLARLINGARNSNDAAEWYLWQEYCRAAGRPEPERDENPTDAEVDRAIAWAEDVIREDME